MTAFFILSVAALANIGAGIALQNISFEGRSVGAEITQNIATASILLICYGTALFFYWLGIRLIGLHVSYLAITAMTQAGFLAYALGINSHVPEMRELLGMALIGVGVWIVAADDVIN